MHELNEWNLRFVKIRSKNEPREKFKISWMLEITEDNLDLVANTYVQPLLFLQSEHLLYELSRINLDEKMSDHDRLMLNYKLKTLNPVRLHSKFKWTCKDLLHNKKIFMNSNCGVMNLTDNEEILEEKFLKVKETKNAHLSGLKSTMGLYNKIKFPEVKEKRTKKNVK